MPDSDDLDRTGSTQDDEEDWFERGLRQEGRAAEDDGPADPEDEVADENDDPSSNGARGAESTGGTAPAGETDAVEEATDVGDGAGGSDEGPAGFESDFAQAFGEGEGVESDDEFGFDVGSGPAETFGFDIGGPVSDESFDDEDFESVIPRIDLGIEGLDEMIQGGIPERSLIVAIGGAGTGKTTFGMQFVNEGLEHDERGVFITLEESRERILRSAAEKGWDFEGQAAAGRLAIVDLDPVDMANSLTSIRNELPRLVEDFGATRLVLDSVSLLEMMYQDQATRRTEVYDFTRALKDAGVTTMLTSEADQDNPYASRHGIIEYLTDAVFVLRYVRPQDFRETRLAIEIQKIRDANHSRETKPYEITGSGISVYRQANIF